MRFSAILAVASTVLSACAQGYTRADVTQIRGDIATIAKEAAGLDKVITDSIKSLNILEALKIHGMVQSHIGSINKATDDVLKITATANVVIAEADAKNILYDINNFAPITEHALASAAAAKPQYECLVPSPLTILVNPVNVARDDICSLRDATIAFGRALIDYTPDDLKSEAAALRDRFIAAFDKAVAAYS